MHLKSSFAIGLVGFVSVSNADIITSWNFNDASPVAAAPFAASNGTTLLGSIPGSTPSVGAGVFTTNAFAGSVTTGGNTYRIGLGSLAGSGTAETVSLTDNSLVVQGGGDPQFLNNVNQTKPNNGKHIQFKTSTVGFEGIKFAFDTRTTYSGVYGVTGFRKQVVSYSTDGTNFTDFLTYTNAGVNVNWGRRTVDLSAVAALNNAPEVFVRLTLLDAGGYNISTSAPQYLYNGANRFDNVEFAGTVAVPEPATLVALGLGAAQLLRRKKK